MPIQPYLSFEGRADEAIEFYKKALGAKVEMLMRFKEAPDPSMISPGSAEKVMHAALKVGDATLLMSDGRNSGKPIFQGISLTLYAKDAAEAQKLFGALATGQGGHVTLPAPLREIFNNAYVHAVDHTFLWSVPLVLVGLVLATMIPEKRLRTKSAVGAGPTTGEGSDAEQQMAPVFE